MALAIILAAMLYFTTKDSEHWQGERTQSLTDFYHAKQAKSCNSRTITISRNGEVVYEDDTLTALFVSDDLTLRISANALSHIFDVDVAILDSGTCSISTQSDGTATAFTCAQADGFIALGDAADALGDEYYFDLDANIAYISETSEVLIQSLPESFDLRTQGRASSVVSQGNSGTCWAFATLTALSSSLLPQENMSFSVDHLSLNSGFNVAQDEGGDFLMALSYLASWRGPVYEVDDPYGDGVTDTSLSAVKHLQEACIIGENDYTSIKKMILEHGGVQSSVYCDITYSNQSSTYYNMFNASYYYNGLEEPNHDIVIIGWDDHYAKENFNVTPEHDGAFICQNSWGTQFGQNGCFYISYDDVNIGTHSIAYTRVDDADNYDDIYQSDQLGWLGSIGYGDDSAWFANVYTASDDQKLEAVSFYTTDKDSYYEIYAVSEFTDESSFEYAVLLSTGYIEQSGYHTVDLSQDISVNGRFAVMVHLETTDAVHPVAIEYQSDLLNTQVDLSDGEGYISSDGKNWQQAEDNYNCNICLKAFTGKAE